MIIVLFIKLLMDNFNRGMIGSIVGLRIFWKSIYFLGIFLRWDDLIIGVWYCFNKVEWINWI